VPGTPGPTVFAVGPTGTDYSIDRGRNWEQTNEDYTNTIGFADTHYGWAVGKKGLILKFEGTVPGGVAPSSEEVKSSTEPKRDTNSLTSEEVRDLRREVNCVRLQTYNALS
jgi:hypothetical protein